MDLGIEVGLVFKFGFGDVELLTPMVVLCVNGLVDGVDLCLFLLGSGD